MIIDERRVRKMAIQAAEMAVESFLDEIPAVSMTDAEKSELKIRFYVSVLIQLPEAGEELRRINDLDLATFTNDEILHAILGGNTWDH